MKQLMYEIAMKVAIEDLGKEETVSGAFVFPSGSDHSRPFTEAGLSGGQIIDYRFPSIKIHYADIAKVMKSYTSRTVFELGLAPVQTVGVA